MSSGIARNPNQEDKANDRQNRVVVRNIRISLLVLFVIVPLIILLIFALRWYLVESTLSATDRRDLVQGLSSMVQALAVLVAGLVGLTGLYFTRETLLHNQQTLQKNQESTKRALDLTEQGQITERFTRAIDQLGATKDGGEKKLEIRLGGIYALGQIARDSPAKHQHLVVEVLLSYIRANAAWANREHIKVDGDIEAALTFIGQRNQRYDAISGFHIQLPGVDLCQYDLSDTHLEYADLRNAHLEAANLHGAYLEEAVLGGAHLEGAHLREAHLERANLVGAHLEGADLRGAYLEGADLVGAHLLKANVQGTDLRNLEKLRKEELEHMNGDATTILPGRLDDKPSWWRTLPVTHEALEPDEEYSIKFCKVPLLFHVDEGWKPDLAQGWKPTVHLPNSLFLSPAGVTHMGPMLSFNYVREVCDPEKPDKEHAVNKAPENPRGWVNWYDNHKHLTIVNGEGEEVQVGNETGLQLDVIIPDDKLPKTYLLSCHRPCVPLFPSTRGIPNRLTYGYKNRMIILNIRGEMITIFIEAPFDEFDDFVEKVDKEILANVKWEVE